MTQLKITNELKVSYQMVYSNNKKGMNEKRKMVTVQTLIHVLLKLVKI